MPKRHEYFFDVTRFPLFCKRCSRPLKATVSRANGYCAFCDPKAHKNVKEPRNAYNQCENAYARTIKDACDQYEKLCEKDRGKAKKLLIEIEEAEGKEFREILLDGIPEKKGVCP